MKKNLLSVFMLVIISSGAFAQLTPGTWFLGGNLLFSNSGNTSSTEYNVTPSIGVLLSSHWEVGLSIGYNNINPNYINPYDNPTPKEFTVGPFVKYLHTFKENSAFYYQFLGYVDLGFPKGSSSATVGVMPGLAWNPVKHFTFDLYYGNIYYTAQSNNNVFGFNITPASLTFGVEYVFPGKKSSATM